MSPESKHRFEEGGGFLGFGCGALLGAALWLWLSLSSDGAAWWPLVLIVIFGFLGARFGDRFFSWVLSKAWWL